MSAQNQSTGNPAQDKRIRRERSKRAYFRSRAAAFLTIVIVVVSVLYVLAQNFMLQENYQVSEVQSSLASFKGRSITIQANVKTVQLESLQNPPLKFSISDGKGELPVVYGSFPFEGFQVGERVLVAGRVEENGQIAATRLVRLSE